jgi:hypothetical protein
MAVYGPQHRSGNEIITLLPTNPLLPSGIYSNDGTLLILPRSMNVEPSKFCLQW